MIAIDATVLAYAVNRYAPQHARAAAVVDGLVNGDRPWALPWPAAHRFLRLVTHAHAVARPLRPQDAVAYLDGVCSSASLTLLAATDRHGVALRELATDGRPGHRLPSGLEVACVLREHGVRELLSTDRTLRRFAFLDVVDPLRDPGWEPARAPARRYRRLPRGGPA